MKYTNLKVNQSSLRNNQRGSALVESILIIGVLTIFMIGVPMIGSMIDLKQTTIQASRYSAWEKTVNVDTDGTAAQIDQRFFRDASAPITTAVNGDVAANALWGASTAPTDGRTEQQLSDKARVIISAGSITKSNDFRGDVNSSTARSEGNARMGDNGNVYRSVSRVVTTLGRVVSPDGWDEGNPISDGLVRSTVGAKIDSNSMFADAKTINESTSIFIDGWSENDNERIRERVHGFVPTNRLEKVGKYVSYLKVIPMLTDLKHLEKAFGCVKTNIVTGKKLGDELTTYNPTGQDNC